MRRPLVRYCSQCPPAIAMAADEQNVPCVEVLGVT